MKHKLLSILLCLAMALSLLPTAALADEATANPVKIGETTEYKTLDAAIDAAKDGDTITILKAAENESGYKLNGNLTYSGKAITIKAADGADVKFDMSAAVALHDAKITFEGVTFDYKTNGNYIGIQHANTLVYNNCTINGQVFLYAASETFNSCTFNQDSADAYNVWTYGAKKVEFNHCTFNCVGKSVLVYNEGAVSSTDLTVTDTEFKASASVEGKAAIEIDTSLMSGGATITIDAVTKSKVSGFGTGSNSGSSLWNDKKQEAESNKNTTVVVAGTTVFAPPAVAKIGDTEYPTLAAAVAAAKGDETVTLLKDVTVTKPIEVTTSMTLDLNGHVLTAATASTATVKNSAIWVTAEKVNLTIDGTTAGSGMTMGDTHDTNWEAKVWGFVDLREGSAGSTVTVNGGSYTGSTCASDNNHYTALFTVGSESKLILNNVSAETDERVVKASSCGEVVVSGGTYNITGINAFLGAAFETKTASFTDMKLTAKYGGCVQVGSNATLENCEIEVTDIRTGDGTYLNCAVAVQNDGTATVKSGIYTAPYAAYVYNSGGTINIENGTFTGVVRADATTGTTAVINIKNGSFNGEIQKGGGPGSETIAISGGTFSSAVKPEYCAPGFEPTQNGNTYGVKIKEDMAAEVLDAQGKTVGAYGKLADAITAAKNGDTVKLLKNVTERVSISKNLVLDLNGKTLTGENLENSNGKHERIALTANAGKVEVKNGIIDGRVNAYDSADLTIDADVTVKNSYNGSGYDCFGIVVWGDGTFGQEGCKTPKLTVNGKVIMEKGGVAISTNGTDKSCAVVTINNGAVISTTEDGAIYLPSGKLIMNGGTVSGPTGIQICAGKADITSDFKMNNGTVIATGADQRASKGTGDGLIPDGAAISVVNRNYPNGVPSVTIDGGSFSSANSDAVLAYTWSNGAASEWTDAKTYVKINDGYFTSDPSAYVVNNGSANIVKRDGSEGAYTYTVLARSSLTSGVYLTDPSGALASNYYVSSTANGVWTVSYSAPYSGGSSSDPTYSVSTPSKTENGSVTVSPKSASKGDTVTVTVKPDSGYVLETLTVTDKNGNELTLKDKGDGKYTFTMPAGKVEVKATFMEDNSMLNFFYDVPNGAYFYEAVKWAVKNGITTGVGNDLFAPEQPCTRAQIVTFLWRAAGSPEPKGAASGMTDVVSGSYYEKAVAWAIENGITTGTTTSTFSPDATCTRAQAVTFLARALKAKAASAAEFSDVPTGSYFADAVAWAAANGVTEGIGGGLFGSDNDCTRGQIVTFLYRAYNK